MGALTPEQVTEVIAQYNQGTSTLKLGKQFGVNPQTVANILGKSGVPLRPKGGRKGVIRSGALTTAQIQEVTNLFKSGFAGVQIAEHFGVSATTIRKYLKRSGIEETDSRIKISPEKLHELVHAYTTENISTIKLAAQVNVSPETVSSALRRAGVTLKPRGQYRMLALREDAFDTLTSDSAYWLGVMATDGCVTGTGDVIDEVKLGLQLIDYHHVAAFKEFLGSEHKISLVQWKHPKTNGITTLGWRFTFRSKQLAAALLRYGIVQRKTYTLVVRNGIENRLHFWTGAVDGDGHVGIHAHNQGPAATLKLSGASKPFIDQFRAYMKSEGVRGDNAVVEEVCGKGCWAKTSKYGLKLGGRAALDAVALLYTDCAQAMPRKARAAAEMIVRGSEGDLVGTLSTKWENPHAVEWAREYLRTHPEEELTLPQEATDQLLALSQDVVATLPQNTRTFIDLLRQLVVKCEQQDVLPGV